MKSTARLWLYINIFAEDGELILDQGSAENGRGKISERNDDSISD